MHRKVKELYKDKFDCGKFHKKLIFCNGGDRTAENIPGNEKKKDKTKEMNGYGLR